MYSDYDNDYGDYYEGSAVDKLFEETAVKLRALVKKDVDEDIKECLAIKEDLEKQRNVLRDREVAVREREKDILHKIKTFTDNKFPEDYIRSQEKKLLNGFSIGETVYIINTYSNYTNCTQCGGTKKIKVLTHTGIEKEVQCPDCGWSGKIEETINTVKKATIIEFSIQSRFRKSTISSEILVDYDGCIEIRREDRDRDTTCHLHDLYATEELALQSISKK